MKGLNSTQLKKIAIIAMTIDHIAWLLPLNNMAIPYFMHVFGRITAPIMWFFISEGGFPVHLRLSQDEGRHQIYHDMVDKV